MFPLEVNFGVTEEDIPTIKEEPDTLSAVEFVTIVHIELLQ